MVQISLRVQAVGLCRLQNSKDDHAGVSPGLSVAEEPVLPADDNRTDRILHLVVADFDLTMVEEGAKILPLVQGIGDGLLQLAGRAKDGLQPGVVLINNGFGEELALLLAVCVWEMLQCLLHFKESAAVFQAFRSQCVLLRRALRHGFDPFPSGMGPAACPGGSAQDVVPAVAVRDHHAGVAAEHLLGAGPLPALLIAEIPNLPSCPPGGGISPDAGFRCGLPTRLFVHLQHGLIRVDHCLPEQFPEKRVAEGLQVGLSCQHHPVRHRIALEVDAQPLPHLLLPVQRQRIGELLHNDIRDDGGRGIAVWNQRR